MANHFLKTLYVITFMINISDINKVLVNFENVSKLLPRNERTKKAFSAVYVY